MPSSIKNAKVGTFCQILKSHTKNYPKTCNLPNLVTLLTTVLRKGQKAKLKMSFQKRKKKYFSILHCSVKFFEHKSSDLKRHCSFIHQHQMRLFRTLKYCPIIQAYLFFIQSNTATIVVYCFYNKFVSRNFHLSTFSESFC